MSVARDVQVGDVLKLAAGDGLVVKIVPFRSKFRPLECAYPLPLNMQVIPAGTTPRLDHYGSFVGMRWLGLWPSELVTILSKGSGSPAAIGSTDTGEGG